MAQAFSSFDTYLAPFVKADGLDYKEVKQCIQSFVYGTNVSSRWGCVPMDTKVLTPDGWKGYDDLQIGDVIYTWRNGVLQEAPLRHLIYHENNYDVLYCFKGVNYQQTVSPDHNVLLNLNSDLGYGAVQAKNVFGNDKWESVSLPVKITAVETVTTVNLTDEEVKTAAEHCAVSNSTGENCDIDEKFLHMSLEQSTLFVETYAAFSNPVGCQYNSETIREKLEIIMIRAGFIPYADETSGCLRAFPNQNVLVTEQEEIPYDGMVWCPNTEDGTAIYRDANGYIFISGNCQAPFSNITLDWTVPEDMKNLPAIVGGKKMPFTYGDCKQEMDMINKAFIEIMIEGDANGRGFQYPINKIVA